MSSDAFGLLQDQPVTRAINSEHDEPGSFVGSTTRMLRSTNPLVPPVDFSSAHHFESAEHLEEMHKAKHSRDRYARDTNANARQLENYFEKIHPRFRCLTFSSGMGAAATLLGWIGNRQLPVLYQSEMYRKTRKLLDAYQHGVLLEEQTVSGMLEVAATLEKAVIFLELPSNPHLRLPPDLKMLVDRPASSLTVCDLTLAGLGRVKEAFLDTVDVALISLTKYIGGHNDALGGILLVKESLYEEMWEERTALGTILHPLDAFLFFRSLRTFDLRFNQQCISARLILDWLEGMRGQQSVGDIYYPGQYANSDQAEAQDFFSGAQGSVFSIVPHWPRDVLAARQAELRFAKIAPSFGSVDTLLEIPSLMSRPNLSETELREEGLEPNLVRISVGLEPPDLIVHDLKRLLGT